MAREIKFRAWFVGWKKAPGCVEEPARMVYNIQNGGGLVWQDGFGDYLDEADYIVEQYTGLKDKNGKEIYEGDVIKVFSTDEYVMGFEGIYRVYFDNHWLSYQMYKIKSSYSSIAESFEPEMSTNIEVIGNIHENPELLK